MHQHLRQRLLIAVFNSEGCFCLFIERHNAGFSIGVLLVGGTAPNWEGQGSKF